MEKIGWSILPNSGLDVNFDIEAFMPSDTLLGEILKDENLLYKFVVDYPLEGRWVKPIGGSYYAARLDPLQTIVLDRAVKAVPIGDVNYYDPWKEILENLGFTHVGWAGEHFMHIRHGGAFFFAYHPGEEPYADKWFPGWYVIGIR